MIKLKLHIISPPPPQKKRTASYLCGGAQYNCCGPTYKTVEFFFMLFLIVYFTDTGKLQTHIVL